VPVDVRGGAGFGEFNNTKEIPVERSFVLPGTLLLAFVSSAPVAAATHIVWPDVVVQLHSSGHAYVVDTRTDNIVADLATCPGGTLGSTTPDGRKVYVSCAADGQKEVVVLDLEKRTAAQRVETGPRPKHAIVSPDGKWVGVNHWALSNGKLHLTFLDARSDTVVKTIDIDVSNPDFKALPSMHNAWSTDSQRFFTLDRVDNRLVVVSMKDWSVTTLPVPSAPHYAVPSPDGHELWLVHEGNDKAKPGIVVYDLTRPEMPVLAQLDMPLLGEEVVEAHHGNFTQDGKLFMALNRGPGKDSRGREVAFFDAKQKRLVQRLTAASNGVGHAYNTPDGKLAVITNYGNNVISIVDVHQIRPVKDLQIGPGRMGHVAFTRDGASAYVSNEKDGNLYKVDMKKLAVVKKIETANLPGGGQVLNVWTNVFEELPRH
jgi:DNA-binding beta-propeller fold protein YncE